MPERRLKIQGLIMFAIVVIAGCHQSGLNDDPREFQQIDPNQLLAEIAHNMQTEQLEQEEIQFNETETAVQQSPGNSIEEEKYTQEVPLVARGWPEKVVYFQNGTVEHLALYLEGYFEQRGSRDDEFGTWHMDDVISLGTGPPVFLANIITLPVAAMVKQPWQKQHSSSIYTTELPAYELPGQTDTK